MNIGLLEDNPAILELMQTALELGGHTISTYTRGQSLLNTLFEKYTTLSSSPASLPYDLLIIDLNLPGELSGLEVIASVYRLLAPNIPPIIVVSAASIEQLDQLRASFPVLPVIRKPFALRTLLQTISSLQSKNVEYVGTDVSHPLDNQPPTRTR